MVRTDHVGYIDLNLNNCGFQGFSLERIINLLIGYFVVYPSKTYSGSNKLTQGIQSYFKRNHQCVTYFFVSWRYNGNYYCWKWIFLPVYIREITPCFKKLLRKGIRLPYRVTVNYRAQKICVPRLAHGVVGIIQCFMLSTSRNQFSFCKLLLFLF